MIPCSKCGMPVEETRECYAVPTCYACLPPPQPLPVVMMRKFLRFADDGTAIYESDADFRARCKAAIAGLS